MYLTAGLIIVLHQMGNHGPAYYKRYPQEFEFFKPSCKTNRLENCSTSEINNAYDNSIIYTDYFLHKVISFLKLYSESYNTSMIYMSDHGESLGENNIYLHGMPYLVAPDNQKHIATLLWFGNGHEKKYSINKLKKIKDINFSHDNLFHTLLGLFNVKSNVYDENMDMLSESGVKQ